jgi:hypothetical protein
MSTEDGPGDDRADRRTHDDLRHGVVLEPYPRPPDGRDRCRGDEQNRPENQHQHDGRSRRDAGMDARLPEVVDRGSHDPARERRHDQRDQLPRRAARHQQREPHQHRPEPEQERSGPLGPLPDVPIAQPPATHATQDHRVRDDRAEHARHQPPADPAGVCPDQHRQHRGQHGRREDLGEHPRDPVGGDSHDQGRYQSTVIRIGVSICSPGPVGTTTPRNV